jgi:hypothetical protein
LSSKPPVNTIFCVADENALKNLTGQIVRAVKGGVACLVWMAERTGERKLKSVAGSWTKE